VFKKLSDIIIENEVNVTKKREELRVLEEKAFEKVCLFRRGLPKGKKPYPGILPVAGEDVSTYLSRIKRMYYGRRSLSFLQKARGINVQSNADKAQIIAMLKEAADELRKVTEGSNVIDEKTAIESLISTKMQQEFAKQNELNELHEKARKVSGSEALSYQSHIAKLKRQINFIKRERESTERKLYALTERLDTSKLIGQTIETINNLVNRIDDMSSKDVSKEIIKIMMAYSDFDASIRRFLVGDIPWSHWLLPLLNWGGLIFLTYLVLFSFNILIFKQWAHNEKLIYPLAELPEHLAGFSSGEHDSTNILPPLFHNGLFWAGLAISASFLGWNMFCYTDIVPGLVPLNFKNYWKPFIEQSIFSGLLPTARSEIFFTMIGLSFLIPKNISFSLWFFSLLYMLELLILVWTGHGVNESSFETEWWTILNFRTSQGGGALLVFSSVILWKCRHYLTSCFMPSSLKNLERDEQIELRIASAVFIASSIGVIILLWKGMGANIWYTLFVCFFLLLLTIGLIRAVTEGGLLGFQAWAGPFHFIRNVLGMNKTWTSPTLFAPLMVYYGVLFLDIKAFIAPAIANAIKIRNDLRIRRLSFHLSLLAAIVLAMLVGVFGEIMMSYANGADEMNSWFHTSLPNVAGFGHIVSLIKNPPASDPVQIGWIAAGAIAMACLIYFRQFFFWLPHPIGMIMLVNPIMIVYWFSIFLGWLFKTLVTKYGNKEVYAKVRGLFLGVIVGELIIVVMAMIISTMLDIHIPIDLNRNAQ